MAAALTASAVEKLKANPARRVEVPDGLLPGFYLVVQPSGIKSWAVRYRHGGRPRKHVLGRYPMLDLAAARQSARTALQAVAVGRDPGAEKIETRKAKAADPGTDMLAPAVESFIKRHVKPNTKARSGGEHLMRKHVLPRWRGRRLDSIKRSDVVSMLDAIVDGGSPVAANRVLAAVRKFFNWCVDRGLLEASPCARVKPPTVETSRDRVLSDAELRLAWSASKKAEPPYGPLVRLLILTAQRREEVGGMRWSEVDGATWTVPADRAKNATANAVPLCDAATAEISAVPVIQSEEGHDYVFTTNGETPFSGFSKCKARLDADMLAIARKEAADRGADPDVMKLVGWRIHDLRRTAATGMARLGVPIHVVEAILNHRSGTISGVAAIYNRHRYEDEKRAALRAWAEHVAEIVR